MDKSENKIYPLDGILVLIVMGIFSGLMCFFNNSGIPAIIVSTIWHTISVPSILIIGIINFLFSSQVLTGIYTAPFFMIYYLFLGILIGKLLRSPNSRFKTLSFIIWGIILLITGYTCATAIIANMHGDASFLPIITVPIIIILFIIWLFNLIIFYNAEEKDLDEELAFYAKEHDIEVEDIPIKEQRKIIFEFDLGKNYNPQKMKKLLSVLDEFDLEKEKVFDKYKNKLKEGDNAKQMAHEINDLIRKSAGRQAEIIGRETFKKINCFYPEEMPDIVSPETYEKKYK